MLLLKIYIIQLKSSYPIKKKQRIKISNPSFHSKMDYILRLKFDIKKLHVHLMIRFINPVFFCFYFFFLQNLN